MLCHNPYCFPSQSQAIFQIGADCPNSIKDLTATWGSAIRQNLGWKCGLGKKTIFGIVMTKVRSVGFSRERSENAGSKAPLSKTLLNNTYIGKHQINKIGIITFKFDCLC